MARYVVTYQIVKPDGSVHHLSQRDIDSNVIDLAVDDPDRHNEIIAAELVARQIVLGDNRVDVINIRPA